MWEVNKQAHNTTHDMHIRFPPQICFEDIKFMRHLSLASFYIYMALNKAAWGIVDMPQWLQKTTGLATWPGEDAPYVPEQHHAMGAIYDGTRREYGECSGGVLQEADCSFDCQKCIAPTDISRCSILSQTFDDGPTDATSRLLDYLQETKTKTTFFVIGMNVIEFPDVMAREKKEGHTIAVHAWSHKFLPALENEQVFSELQWCIWAINATTGQVPKYFRPPYGGLDNRIRDIAGKLGLKTVLWDHDTCDWKVNVGEITQAEVLKEVSTWASNHPPRKWYQWSKPMARGLILEHDLTSETVELAINIHSKLSHKQKKVDWC